jgi:cytochrome c-type biogenesis protein CcmH
MTGAPLPFLLAAAAMIAAALAFAVLPLWRRRDGGGVRRGASNVAIYRTQVADLDREYADGVIDASEHAAATVEITRRLLEDAGDEAAARPASARVVASILALVLPIAAGLLYGQFGDPSAAAEDALGAAPADTRSRLVAHLDRQAHDGRARILLARLDAGNGRYAEAARGYEAALAASPKIARDAGVWCELADALGMANGGRLAGRPTELIVHALTLDAAHPQALEMAGSAAWEREDFRAAAHYWRVLLAQLDGASRAHAELEAAVARAERRALTRLPVQSSAVPPRGS